MTEVPSNYMEEMIKGLEREVEESDKISVQNENLKKIEENKNTL